MEIVVGDVVTGENLYGRERDLEVLWDRIRNNSILLSSPRRFGKTSLVREMQRNPKRGFEVIYVDVESAQSPDDFVLKLAGRISRPHWQRALELLTGARESVESLKVSELTVRLREHSSSWQDKGLKLFEALENKHIVVLDELPLFLLSLDTQKGDVQEFMAWLREIRQTYGVRFILCGSISIDGVLARHRLGNSINDLERIKVPPFDRNTALSMIEHILQNYKIVHDHNHAEMIVDKIGVAIPYFVQLILRQILDETEYGRMALTSDAIENAYGNAIFGDEGHKYFRWYFDRLENEFPNRNQRSVAKQILDHVATGRPSSEQDLKVIFHNEVGDDTSLQLNDIVQPLRDGFYLEAGQSYAFATKVLQDWWVKERGLSVGL